MTHVLTASLFLGALVALPVRAQVNVEVSLAARLGPEVGVVAYSRERLGDWRANYRRWTPVRLYKANGRYYLNNVAGTRAVELYRYHDAYFLPPREQAWVNYDKRFSNENRPTEEDQARARLRR
jgi:hypothetical protein